MDLKEKLDKYIEHMNSQPQAIDSLILLQNYAGEFMLAYERGELVVKETMGVQNANKTGK